MTTSLALRLGLLLVAWPWLHVVVQGALDTPGNPGGGGCVYSFQVWTPNQDVLNRLRSLELTCTNSSYRWERELGLLKTQFVNEVLTMRNLTHRMEKDLLEQKLEDVQLRINLKDFKMELMTLKNENDDIRTTMDSLQSGPRASGHAQGQSVSSREFNQLNSQLSGFRSIVGQLKNGVGDLKGEWLIIKREVQDIKSENTQLKFGQNDIKADALKLKSLMEAVQADTTQLKNNQDQLQAVNTKLMKSVNDLKDAGSREADDEEDEETRNSGRIYEELADMRVLNEDLQKQIQRMRHKNVELKRELLAVALAARNVSKDEIEVWLQKLPFLQVPAMTHPSERTYGHPPRDCHEVHERGYRVSGVYQVQPRGTPQLDNVYCEMLNGSGWTLVQRRRDGTLSFNRRWLEYKFGFGNLYGEFWIGNEVLHRLTSQRTYRLRVDMWDWEGLRAFAEYDYFRIDSEKTKYRLHVRGHKGNAGDSMSFHDGMAFSTEDNDNDLHMRNCAVDNKGGWWYNSCYTSNLNGIYHSGWYSHGSQTFADGIVWYTWKQNDFYSLKHVELKVKPA